MWYPEAKKEVKQQLLDFINNHEIQGQQLINIAVSKSMQKPQEAKP